MKILIFLTLLFSIAATAKTSLYNCTLPRPEMAGSHNMVLFGEPTDELYVYHLPLFAGEVNGMSGHVLMHVYQGLWNISLDDQTMTSYSLKFAEKKTTDNPFPFFSISPRGDRFKVPQIICDQGFTTDVLAAYGHVESNPDFPTPEILVNQLSKLEVKGQTVFARRFDGSSKNNITYILFGNSHQYYMAHFLTDDENSFDQIVAVEIESEAIKTLVSEEKTVLVNVPRASNSNLVAIEGAENSTQLNNKFALPISPLGQQVNISVDDLSGQVKVEGQIYFNKNGDLKVKN